MNIIQYRTPLNYYHQTIFFHIISSEIIEVVQADLAQPQTTICNIPTKLALIDSLHLFFLFNQIPTKKAYKLSKSEQQYQTITLKQTILQLPLVSSQLLIFWEFFKKRASSFQIANGEQRLLCITGYNVRYIIETFPLMRGNKSDLFQSLFATQTSDLRMLIDLVFNTPNIKKQLFLF